MAVQTLTVPGRTYQPGVTSGQKSLPGTQHYSHVTFTFDLTGWVSALTTRVSLQIEWSFDSGATWVPLFSVAQDTPPPYPHKGGSTNSIGGTTDIAPAVDPTHVRGSLTVEGAAVTLGQFVLSAS